MFIEHVLAQFAFKVPLHFISKEKLINFAKCGNIIGGDQENVDCHIGSCSEGPLYPAVSQSFVFHGGRTSSVSGEIFRQSLVVKSCLSHKVSSP